MLQQINNLMDLSFSLSQVRKSEIPFPQLLPLCSHLIQGKEDRDMQPLISQSSVTMSHSDAGQKLTIFFFFFAGFMVEASKPKLIRENFLNHITR